MNKNNYKILDKIKYLKKNYFFFLKKNTNLSNKEINLISYGFQAGSYVKYFNKNKNNPILNSYYDQIYIVLKDFIKPKYSVIEAGSGEGNMLFQMMRRFKKKKNSFFGFDYSFSRLFLGKKNLEKYKIRPNIFLSDMTNIGVTNNSFDVVFTNHALEPNGGNEEIILKELLRIANKYVILFEPIYELSPKINQKRMDRLGYVKNLYKICKKLDCKIIEHKLLETSINKKNLTGVIILKKKKTKKNRLNYKCVLTDQKIYNKKTYYYNKNIGIIYPVIKKIPILIDKSAIIAPNI